MSNSKRSRRVGVIATALAALSLAIAGAAWAAGADRLSGGFSLRGEIIEASGDFAAARGENIMRDAFFKPLCRRGACDVRANVEVNGERVYVVLTLDRRYHGYYRGTTKFRIRCGGGTSNGRAIFSARATQVTGGYVRRLRARMFTQYTGPSCSGHTEAHLHGQKSS